MISTHTTTSADGTTIAYRSLGSGPGLVIVHGSMQSATSQLELAEALGDSHTVHLVDRRGRGLSGELPAEPSTALEVADLRAVLEATDSHGVFGVSSGAIIAARAALVDPRIQRLGLFEPPLVVRGSLSLDFVPRFEQERAAGDLVGQMVTGMLAAQMGAEFMLRAPRSVLRFATRRMLIADDKKVLPDDVPHLREIAATLPADFAVVRENAERAQDFAALRAATLLVTGTKTRPYLRAAIDELERVIPNAQRVDLPGLWHSATQNRDQYGKPALVAQAIRGFFAPSRVE